MRRKNEISSQMAFVIDKLSKKTGIDLGVLCRIFESSREHYNKIDKLSDFFKMQKENSVDYGLTAEKAGLYSYSEIEFVNRYSNYVDIVYHGKKFPEPSLQSSSSDILSPSF